MMHSTRPRDLPPDHRATPASHPGVETLREQVRASQGKRLYRKDLASLKTAVVVLTDDLFGAG